MKEYPIIFSADMVQAILEDRKTMTRRVIKPQPDYGRKGAGSDTRDFPNLRPGGDSDFYTWDGLNSKLTPTRDPQAYRRWRKRFLQYSADDRAGFIKALVRQCPYGQVGDRLWVKETWCAGCVKEPKPFVCYKAGTCPELWPPCQESIVKSPRFMFRKDSRITLEITGVRVERLRDITPNDIYKEGIRVSAINPEADIKYRGALYNAFIKLWDSLNAKRGYSWESNPWVWVITFRRLTDADGEYIKL